MNSSAGSATKAVVSFDSDQLILVDSQDQQLGSADKLTCHDGDGMLHRAFSVLLFNSRGELLLQKRAKEKRLWGDYWSNSCCSHPRLGESMDEACERRMLEELGLRAKLTFLYKFEYHADFGSLGAEHELCWVYIGRCDEEPSINENEASAWRYVSPKNLDSELASTPGHFTPWFKMEWDEIRLHYQARLDELLR